MNLKEIDNQQNDRIGDPSDFLFPRRLRSEKRKSEPKNSGSMVHRTVLYVTSLLKSKKASQAADLIARESEGSKS